MQLNSAGHKRPFGVLVAECRTRQNQIALALAEESRRSTTPTGEMACLVNIAPGPTDQGADGRPFLIRAADSITVSITTS